MAPPRAPGPAPTPPTMAPASPPVTAPAAALPISPPEVISPPEIIIVSLAVSSRIYKSPWWTWPSWLTSPTFASKLRLSDNALHIQLRKYAISIAGTAQAMLKNVGTQGLSTVSSQIDQPRICLLAVDKLTFPICRLRNTTLHSCRDGCHVGKKMLSLGTRIRRTRRLAGLSQRALANLLGVTHGTVGHWETNRSLPNARMLIEFSRITGVDLHWLVFGHPHANQTPPDASSRDVVRRTG